MKITVYPAHPHHLWSRVHPLHAAKDGHPVLRGESSWRTLSGFGFYVRQHHVIVELRRHS